MDRFNHFGYAAYFIILELLHKDGVGDALAISPSRLCQKLRSRQTKVRELLDFCRTSGKVESDWKPNEVWIQINKFRERQSNLKSKLISKPYQPNSNLALEEKIEDKKRKEESKQITDRPLRSVFVPPSLNDVKSYFIERGTKIDPEQFFAHYESNGWVIGKARVKNWKACLTTWEKNSYGTNQGGRGESHVRTQPTEGKYASLERKA